MPGMTYITYSMLEMYVQCTMYCIVQSHASHVKSLNCSVSDTASVLTNIYCDNHENA